MIHLTSKSMCAYYLALWGPKQDNKHWKNSNISSTSRINTLGCTYLTCAHAYPKAWTGSPYSTLQIKQRLVAGHHTGQAVGHIHCLNLNVHCMRQPWQCREQHATVDGHLQWSLSDSLDLGTACNLWSPSSNSWLCAGLQWSSWPADHAYTYESMAA